MSQSHSLKSINNMMISEIKCFQHCKASERYLCFELPEKCPTCEFGLMSSTIKFKVPPFVVPRPLKLTDTRLKCLPPYSLLLQPTDCNYTRLAAEPDIGDLHIGVTNSDSDVFDFNQNGLNKNAHNWIDTPSIIIDIKRTSHVNNLELDHDNAHSCPIDFKWNMLLDRHWKRRKEMWNRAFYDENNFNCLDFVINFLLEYGFFDWNLDNSSQNDIFIYKSIIKKKISKEYIEPEFIKCLRYLNMIINLHEKKYLVEQLNS